MKRKERVEVYERMLIDAKSFKSVWEEKQYNGLCHFLWNIGETHPVDDFPELLYHKPIKSKRDNAYWFDRWDIDRRIKIIEDAIAKELSFYQKLGYFWKYLFY